MSLSFPVLISAVPLFAVDWSRKDNAQKNVRPSATKCWFSDGGICSNFPIHFFDGPIPRWPTFGINLKDFHPDHPPVQGNEALNIWMPMTNGGGLSEHWVAFENSLLGFLGAMLDTSMSWVDNQQLKVPGYRDRVVHVCLDRTAEGGLNLDMDPKVIAVLSERGKFAGAKLVDRFSNTRPTDGSILSWDNHRWVRFRSTLELTQKLLMDICKRANTENSLDPTYVQLISNHPSYQMNAKEKAAALQFLTDVCAHAQSVNPANHQGSPKPTPILRIAPNI